MTRSWLISAIILAVAALPARAHHTWFWNKEQRVELTGVVEKVLLGNPHGVLKMTIGDATWTIEIGSPKRNGAAGLHDATLPVGCPVTVVGWPALEPDVKRAKALAVRCDDRLFDLYPGEW